jgi:hypothetical protein
MCAALMWVIVGGVLLAVGAKWTLQSGVAFAPLLLMAAAATGVVKAQLILRHTAHQIGSRILTRGDGKCLGGFLSWRFWMLVAVMAASGRVLRTMPIPIAIVGFVYTAVGVALISGSRITWRSWMGAS